MFYTLSKVAWFFATPSNLLVSLILLGLLLALFKRVRPFGIGLSIAMTLATITLGLSPIASYVLPRWRSGFRPSATMAGLSTGSFCSAAPSRRRIRPPAA